MGLKGRSCGERSQGSGVRDQKEQGVKSRKLKDQS